MPEIIQFKNGNQIRNKYNAAGQKLSSRNITVEAGVYQPLNPGDIIENPDVNENDNVTVEGMDHIGNMEYYSGRYFDWGSTTHAAATVQRTQYYPSGLPWHTNTGVGADVQNHKYNGKEFVEMHGLDEYDSEARWYYPAIMRTATIDPLAEKYYSISPYAWCGNNPVKFVDPDGRTYGFPESGGKPAVEPKLNSQTGKIEGQFTSAQSTTRTEKPTEKIEPIKNQNPDNGKKTPPITSPGEIKDANEVQRQEFHNFAMSTEINRACLTNTALKSFAVGGAVVTGGVAIRVVLPNAASVNTVSTNVINWANTTAIGVQNASGVSAISIGAGLGVIQSALPYDAPILSVNPGVDASSSAIQVLTKLF